MGFQYSKSDQRYWPCILMCVFFCCIGIWIQCWAIFVKCCVLVAEVSHANGYLVPRSPRQSRHANNQSDVDQSSVSDIQSEALTAAVHSGGDQSPQATDESSLSSVPSIAVTAAHQEQPVSLLHSLCYYCSEEYEEWKNNKLFFTL